MGHIKGHQEEFVLTDESMCLAVDVLYILTCNVSAKALVVSLLEQQPVVLAISLYVVHFVTKMFLGWCYWMSPMYSA